MCNQPWHTTTVTTVILSGCIVISHCNWRSVITEWDMQEGVKVCNGSLEMIEGAHPLPNV